MQVIRLDTRIALPTKEDGNAGYDLQAVALIEDDTNDRVPLALYGNSTKLLRAGETIKFCTGLKIFIEDQNLVGLIFARSKLGANFGVVPANCVGVIDSSYQGELIVALTNYSENTYKVKDMEKIAQLVIVPVYSPIFEEVSEFRTTTDRGETGIMCEEQRK